MNRMLWIILGIIGVASILLMLNDSSGQTLGMANNDFVELVWFGILAVVIGAGLLRSRQRMGDMARSFAIWTLIVVALIAGYQYRYELQDVASRVSAGLIPGSPLSLSIEDGRATVTLDKASNGHFAARILVNGTSIQTVVDTGATTTVLTAQDARDAGFDPDTLHYTVRVSTANGVTNASAVRTNEISIGGIVRKNMPVLVAAPGTLQQSLLGMNFMSSLSGFDVRGDRMILHD